MEQSEPLKYYARVAAHPRKKLSWKPFLVALSDVVGSDIEFLATGERVESESTEPSRIEEPKK